jgi:hypothetical protein
MSLELEVEKIRDVRRGIAQQFDFDAAKLGEYYRKQERTLKAVARAKAEISEASDGTKAVGDSRRH